MKRIVLKRFPLTFVLASLATSAFAGGYKDSSQYKDAIVCPGLQGGWYVGVQGGHDNFKVDERIIDTGTSANPNLSATGLVGGLFAGYGYYHDNFYLGGELYLNTTSADYSWNANLLAGSAVYDSKFKAKTSYGVNVFPGYRLNNTTTGFLKLGYNQVHVEHTGRVAGGSDVNKSETMAGISYGLGVETLLTGNWSIRFDYTHYNLDSATNTLSSTASTKFDVEDNQAMIGVIYHIA